ncbi:probable 26S protease subunit YTA6 [Kluyveromyces marxianus DMKU3-1042]|uniref:Probable 26S protease subunit YTA6 n=1 Tax=Kluyveromyces marxianus (strain DMKU3-1042 / BCC 29191 / NBRC 104275) TaxID=1003335 RepID=W0T8H2_KLUMD|nr:probable 26S protease subunit YTA6 [Kluyveromyces marxianus DMKU3-1042]BAO38379.1 probable 26S protease subunit YTA6 [Kluyveromyces marxianus DMKU3-1042]
MPDGHFTVPKNASLNQSLLLLYSIVRIQLENIKERVSNGTTTNASAEKILISVLNYLREGLKTIGKHFNIDNYNELKNTEVISKYEDVKGLDRDIKDILMGLQSKTSQKGSDKVWMSRLKLNFKRSNKNFERERSAKEQSEDEELLRETAKILQDAEERATLQLEGEQMRIENQSKMEGKDKYPKTRTKRESVLGTQYRKSMDSELRRNVSNSSRRISLDGYKGRSGDYTVYNAPEINKAALLAWGNQISEMTPTGQSGERHGQQKKTPQLKAKPKYVYNKPTIRRPVIKTMAKSMPVSRSSYSNGVTEISVSDPDDREKSDYYSEPTSPTVDQPPIKLSPFEQRVKTAMDNMDGVDDNVCHQILNEILITDEKVFWDDISGLENAKGALKETVVYPFLRPDLFQGLRVPVSGILLFGPPGTGKTLLAKAVATESKSTFFSISASSILSKYLGESEKLVKALFYLAKELAPSIIFVDEIDSLLSARTDNDNESSRRVKTEFLIHWSSLSSASTTSQLTHTKQVLVLAATNTPWDLDEAARRRFSKKIYIPLPDRDTRYYHLKRLMEYQRNDISEDQFQEITKATQGYSGSDLTSLAKDAAMEPIRDLGERLIDINLELVRPVVLQDFVNAMKKIKPSVSPDSLLRFEEWTKNYGST